VNLTAFDNLEFPSGHFIESIRLVEAKMLDPIGRPALAKSIIEGKRIRIEISDQLDSREVAVSIYHEVLEALTVAVDTPPQSVLELNEAGFEKEAHEAYAIYDSPTPERVLSWIKSKGF
jgi:hypothetical protein